MATTSSYISYSQIGAVSWRSSRGFSGCCDDVESQSSIPSRLSYPHYTEGGSYYTQDDVSEITRAELDTHVGEKSEVGLGWYSIPSVGHIMNLWEVPLIEEPSEMERDCRVAVYVSALPTEFPDVEHAVYHADYRAASHAAALRELEARDADDLRSRDRREHLRRTRREIAERRQMLPVRRFDAVPTAPESLTVVQRIGRTILTRPRPEVFQVIEHEEITRDDEGMAQALLNMLDFEGDVSGSLATPPPAYLRRLPPPLGAPPTWWDDRVTCLYVLKFVKVMCEHFQLKYFMASKLRNEHNIMLAQREIPLLVQKYAPDGLCNPLRLAIISLTVFAVFLPSIMDCNVAKLEVAGPVRERLQAVAPKSAPVTAGFTNRLMGALGIGRRVVMAPVQH
jgi:hypothetical protein